eukprot:SAG31_NODE_25879_length_452_cov_0.881020_1_plen_91_part_00
MPSRAQRAQSAIAHLTTAIAAPQVEVADPPAHLTLIVDPTWALHELRQQLANATGINAAELIATVCPPSALHSAQLRTAGTRGSSDLTEP